MLQQATTMSSAEIYRQLPLDSDCDFIRIFEVLEEEFEGHLQCVLHKVSLASQPRYNALSYTWGDDKDKSIIFVNHFPLEVRANLYSFLLEAQKRKRSRVGKSWAWLWVDSICIDQLNVGERNQQVQRMGQIYSEAAYVIVWLGPETPDTAQVFKDAKSQFTPILKFLQSAHQSQEEAMKFWSEIIDRPYWVRLWVVQELLLAKDVKIVRGSCTMTWQQLGRNIPLRLWWHKVRRKDQLWLKEFSFFDSRPKGSVGQEHDLAELVVRFGFKGCLNPRDRIFGLQSLVPESDRVKVDYSISCEDLFLQVAQILVRKAKRFQKYLIQKNPSSVSPRGDVDVFLILRCALEAFIEVTDLPEVECIKQDLDVFGYWQEYLKYLRTAQKTMTGI